MQLKDFPSTVPELGIQDTGERRYPMAGEQYMYIGDDGVVHGPYGPYYNIRHELYPHPPGQYAIYKETEVTSYALGKFYKGGEFLAQADKGKVRSPVPMYDQLNDAITEVGKGVNESSGRRYVVQVVAVLEPEPPQPPPYKVTKISRLDDPRG